MDDPTVGNQAGAPWRVIDDVRPLAVATVRPGYAATPADVAAYAQDGVVLLRGLYVDWVEPLRSGLERMLAAPQKCAFPADSTGAGEPGRFFDSYCNWQLVPEFLTFVLASSAAALAASMMGSESAQLFHEHSFSKEAGTQKATPWHHDLPYYCVDGNQTASVYVALDDAPPETAVRFLKGSHRSGQLYYPRNFSAGKDYVSADPSLTTVPEIAADDPRIMSVGLEAGDVLVFNFRTLHGTTDAPVANRRRAFSTRWLGDDIGFLDRPGETSPPLTDLGLSFGDRMREDWFPVLWPSGAAALESRP